MAVLHDNVAAYEQSLTCYRRMEALAERTRDRETFAMVANCIGVTLHRMGRYEDAIEAHLKHRKVATSTAAHIYALCNEGLAQRVLGNFSRAVLCHRHALDAALESNDVAGEGLASGHLGFDYTAWLTRAASVTAAEASLAHEAGTAFLERYMELSETRPVRRDYNALLNAFLVARGEEKDGARAGGAGSAQPLPLLEHAIAGLFMIDSHSPPPPSLSLSLSLSSQPTTESVAALATAGDLLGRLQMLCDQPEGAMQAFEASLAYTEQLSNLGCHDFGMHDAAATGVGVAIGTRDLAERIGSLVARGS